MSNASANKSTIQNYGSSLKCQFFEKMINLIPRSKDLLQFEFASYLKKLMEQMIKHYKYFTPSMLFSLSVLPVNIVLDGEGE